MKYRKPLMAAFALICLLAATSLTGCKDDNDGPNYPDNFAFRQYLRVEQWNDGTTNAFADFIGLNQAGMEISLELPKKATIFANGTQLRYEEPEAGDEYSFAYSAQLAGTPKTVTFVFNRTPTLAITNSVNLETVPFIRLQAGNKVENNKNYTYTSSLQEATSAKIRIFLMRMDGSKDEQGKTFDATLFGNQYYFSGVPAGTYLLRSMATLTINNLQEQNGGAGGRIQAVKVYEIKGVTVE